MSFLKRINFHALGFLSDSDYPETGLCGVGEGLESESLYILAGLSNADSPFLLHDFFQRALAELRIVFPSKREALVALVREIAEQIVNESADAYIGFAQIDDYIQKAPIDYYDIGLLDAYGIYISVWGVLNDEFQFHDVNETKEDYVERTKRDLRSELGDWLKLAGGA
ncbi:MAG: hypothetical protein EOP04_18155 [Proteobacteria bacterium]|nr:MAG: hypothetical protein EOP04_18155 [Pseudomonadota bacterium]